VSASLKAELEAPAVVRWAALTGLSNYVKRLDGYVPRWTLKVQDTQHSLTSKDNLFQPAEAKQLTGELWFCDEEAIKCNQEHIKHTTDQQCRS